MMTSEQRKGLENIAAGHFGRFLVDCAKAALAEIDELRSQQRNWTLEARELTQYGRTGVVDIDPEGMRDV